MSLRVLTHTRNHYDGAAFTGLTPGALGEYGLLTRTESLAFTDAFLDSLYRSDDPPAVGPRPVYLARGGATAWTGEYPREFRDQLPALAGYVHRGDGEIPGSPGGYYVVSARHQYDVHVPGRVPRGLPSPRSTRWAPRAVSSTTGTTCCRCVPSTRWAWPRMP